MLAGDRRGNPAITIEPPAEIFGSGHKGMVAFRTPNDSPAPRSRRLVGRIQSFRSSVVAAFVGLALSALAWFAVAAWEERVAASAFAVRASNRTLVLQNGIDDYENVLASVRAFFDATEGSVSRDAFNVFTKALLIDRKGDPRSVLGPARHARRTRRP